MKYALVSVLFLMNNEIISWITLLLLMLMFFGDIVKARFY